LARHVLALDFETDLRFNAALFPDPVKAPAAHLAAVRSHPKSFVEHLLKIHPMQAGDILLRNNQRPLVTLRADVDQMDVPAAAELAVHGEVPRFLVALEGWSEGLERLVESGQLSPQDPTSAKPIRNLAAMAAQGNLPHFTPRQILDYCAGLGTKTIQLARTFPEAKITATDLANEKLSRLHARVQRLKLANVKTCPLTEIEKGFDLIVVDVPCSNTGVFAKRVQSRWRWPALDHEALGALQLQLLQQAAAVLGPQGLLLYSTCSIDPAENQERVRSFLAQSPAFHVVAEEFTLPSLAAPPNAPHDGGYFALLQRR